MLSTASSAEEAAQPSSLQSTHRPIDLNRQFIIWSGNPAHLEGVLHELSKFISRDGYFIPLLTDRAVLMSNGKMAVDSVQASLFLSEEVASPAAYSFDNPCPPTEQRITAYDQNAQRARPATPTFIRIQTLPAQSNIIVNSFVVDSADRKLFGAIIQIITDSDKRARLEDLSEGKGTTYSASCAPSP